MGCVWIKSRNFVTMPPPMSFRVKQIYWITIFKQVWTRLIDKTSNPCQEKKREKKIFGQTFPFLEPQRLTVKKFLWKPTKLSSLNIMFDELDVFPSLNSIYLNQVWDRLYFQSFNQTQEIFQTRKCQKSRTNTIRVPL